MAVKRLSDCFEDIHSDGIFCHMTQAPWYTVSNAMDLDMEYLWNHSGLKLPSPLVRKLVDEETGYLDRGSQISLARILWTKYGNKWSGLWETLVKFAITPYQQGSFTDTVSRNGETGIVYGKKEKVETEETLAKAGSESETETPNEWTTERTVTGGWADADTTSTTRTGSQRTTDRGSRATNVFGFNSVSAVGERTVGPTDPVNGTSQETTFGENGLKDTNAGAITRTYNAYKDASKTTGTKTVSKSFNNREDTTTGTKNISNSGSDTHTTSESESRTRTGHDASIGEILLELLDGYDGKDFFETVYSDIDEVMTLRVWI